MRSAIRLGIPIAAAAAIALGIALPVHRPLPSIALGSRELLWVERALAFFYGFLLLFVPALRAVEGELPIELTTRGARYAEASDQWLEELQTRVETLEDNVVAMGDLVAELADETA